jgi:hypothetical protein
MKRSYLIAGLLLLFFSSLLFALPLDLSQYHGEGPVIVIFARDNDEPRAFSFNLALSTEWNRIEARRISTVDVGPGRYDLDAVARQLKIENDEFEIVVIDTGGEIIHRTADPGALAQILMIIDQELNRDRSSISS